MFEQRNIRTSGSRGLLAVTALSCVTLAGITSDEAWGQEECEEEIQKILASDGAANDQLSWHMVLRGGILAIGSVFDDDLGTDAGSVYVFRREGDTWVEEQKLTASDGASGDWFGVGIALSDDYLMVGSRDDDLGTDAGSVYVFRHDGRQWVEEAKLFASNGAPRDYFGNRISIGDEYMLIAAPDYDDSGGGPFGPGKAYVFHLDDNGTPEDPTDDSWLQEAILTASDNEFSAHFGGFHDAIEYPWALVGAHKDNNDAGALYVFRHDGNEWIEEDKLAGQPGEQLGIQAYKTGDCLTVATQQTDRVAFYWLEAGVWIEAGDLNSSQENTRCVSDGAILVASDRNANYAELFIRDDNGTPNDPNDDLWSDGELITADGVAGGDWFGELVLIDEETLLVSSILDDDNGSNAGAVYVFDISDCLGAGDCVEPPQNLIGWWPGDGNAADIAGGNFGTILGGMGFDEGMVEQAFSLDNVDDGVEIPNTDGVYDLVEEWTVDAWVFPFAPGLDPRNDPIVWKTGGTNGGSQNKDTFYIAWGCSACAVTSRFQTGLERASDDDDFRTTSEVHPPGAWYHVAGVYDGTDLIIYVNGVEEGRETIGSVVAYTTPDPLTIGNILHSDHGNAGVFDGSIDEVDVFDRALSAEEIAAIYLAGSAGKCKPESTTATLLSVNVAGGNLVGGDLQSLEESDDDYVQIDAQLSYLGTAYVSRTLVRAKSPATTVSRLDLTVETGVDAELVTTRVFLLNFDTGDWDLLEGFSQSESDSQALILDVPNPNAYVRDDHGQIAVQIETRANAAQVPGGYIFRIDQVQLAVTTGEGGGIAGGDDDAFACDLDGDGVVGASDLMLLLGAWGECGNCNTCPPDINNDCVVDAADLLILLGNWG